MNNTYYKTSDLTKMFDISPQTVKREYDRKKLHGFYIGNELRFTQQDIDDYTCILEHHKTLREIELENENKKLKEQLLKRDEFVCSIKQQVFQYESNFTFINLKGGQAI